MNACGNCGAPLVENAAYCAACGRRAGPPAPAPAWAPASPRPQATFVPAPASGGAPAWTTPAPGAWSAPAPLERPRPPLVVAILALVLNVFVWPGLGSLIAGEKVGWAQGFLALAAIFLGFLLFVTTIIGIFVGILLWIGAWVWGVVTGALLVRRASA